MSKLEIKATPVLGKLLKSEKRFALSVGSSRSSKTYSMLQWIVLECVKNPSKGIYISVVRASFPSLRRTVYREFVDMAHEDDPEFYQLPMMDKKAVISAMADAWIIESRPRNIMDDTEGMGNISIGV